MSSTHRRKSQHKQIFFDEAVHIEPRITNRGICILMYYGDVLHETANESLLLADLYSTG